MHGEEANALLQQAALLAINDPLAGNRWIANLYFELSDRLGDRLHENIDEDEPRNATFPTFAAWSAESLAADVAPLDEELPESVPQSLALVDLRRARGTASAVRDADDDWEYVIALSKADEAAETVVAVADEIEAEVLREPASEAASQLDDLFKEIFRGDHRGEPLQDTVNRIRADVETAVTKVEVIVDVLVADLRQSGIGFRRQRDARKHRGGPLWVFYRRLAQSLVEDDSIATNIAAGQGEILVEIGQALNLFLELFDRPFFVSDERWAEFAQGVYRQALERQRFTRVRSSAAGLSRDEAFGPSHVTELLNGVRPYFDLLALEKARDADGGKKVTRQERAELILLGNLRMVAYEQKRLQKLLERNLLYLQNAAIRRAGSRLMQSPIPPKVLLHEAGRLEALSGPATDALQILATRYAFNMIIGNETLTFGRDLPLPPAADPLDIKLGSTSEAATRSQSFYSEGLFFPDALSKIANRDLWTLWKTHSRAPSQGARTKVNNWLRYPERMNFIANLFRSRQQMATLNLGRQMRILDVGLPGGDHGSINPSIGESVERLDAIAKAGAEVAEAQHPDRAELETLLRALALIEIDLESERRVAATRLPVHLKDESPLKALAGAHLKAVEDVIVMRAQLHDQLEDLGRKLSTLAGARDRVTSVETELRAKQLEELTAGIPRTPSNDERAQFSADFSQLLTTDLEAEPLVDARQEVDEHRRTVSERGVELRAYLPELWQLIDEHRLPVNIDRGQQ